MKRFTFGLLISIFCFSGNSFAQSFKSNLQLADEAYAQKNYYTAAMYYLKVFDELQDPEKTVYPYKPDAPLKKNEEFNTYRYVIARLADSYYKYHDYTNAEVWYAKSTALNEFKDLEELMNYGSVLRANERFDEAIVMFKKAKRIHVPLLIKNEEGVQVEDEKSKDISRRISFELASAEFAAAAITKPYNNEPELLDTIKVNLHNVSAYSGAPMLGDRIMFTTTRFRIDNPTSKRKGDFANTLMTYHLYDSTLHKIDFGFGIDRNVAAPSFTGDNMRMYFTSWSAELDKPIYQIFYSKPLNDSIWEEAKLLSEVVNMPNTRSLHPYVTSDGKGLYFASDRPEGFGGLDIYYVRLDDRGFPTGNAVNLGPNVNSDRDDQTPWFDEDSQTLYFSSNGWVGMGGLDNFYSQRRADMWSVPVNLGYPVNTTKDDAYLSTTPNSSTAYLASDRSGECCYKLYTVELTCNYAGGVVLDGVDDSPLAGVKVTAFNKEGNIEYGSTVTDNNGRYYFPIENLRDYQVVFQKQSFLDNDLEFNSGRIAQCDTIELEPVKMLTIDVGKAVKLENIYYDFDKATLRPESMVVLDKLARNLRKFPFLVIEIGSHTDSKGTDEYNYRLSNARSQSVVNYLISQGIERDMIFARGYGESQPKVPNTFPDGSDNPENRQINRRTEFKVLEYRYDRMNQRVP